eukprot:517584_1
MCHSSSSADFSISHLLLPTNWEITRFPLVLQDYILSFLSFQDIWILSTISQSDQFLLEIAEAFGPFKTIDVTGIDIGGLRKFLRWASDGVFSQLRIFKSSSEEARDAVLQNCPKIESVRPFPVSFRLLQILQNPLIRYKGGVVQITSISTESDFRRLDYLLPALTVLDLNVNYGDLDLTAEMGRGLENFVQSRSEVVVLIANMWTPTNVFRSLGHLQNLRSLEFIPVSGPGEETLDTAVFGGLFNNFPPNLEVLYLFICEHQEHTVFPYARFVELLRNVKYLTLQYIQTGCPEHSFLNGKVNFPNPRDNGLTGLHTVVLELDVRASQNLMVRLRQSPLLHCSTLELTGFDDPDSDFYDHLTMNSYFPEVTSLKSSDHPTSLATHVPQFSRLKSIEIVDKEYGLENGSISAETARVMLMPRELTVSATVLHLILLATTTSQPQVRKLTIIGTASLTLCNEISTIQWPNLEDLVIDVESDPVQLQSIDLSSVDDLLRHTVQYMLALKSIVTPNA